MKNIRKAYGMLLIPIAFFLIFVCWPTLQTIYISFTDWKGIGVKNWIGLENYRNQWTVDETFWKAIKNNVFWALGMIIVPQIIGLTQASLMVRGKIQFFRTFQLVFFLPQVVSTVVAAIIWRWIYDPLSGPLVYVFKELGMNSMAFGWLGNPKTVMLALFIVNVWLAYGFCTIIYNAAIRSIDESLYEASVMDGANSMAQFVHITMPGIREAITVVTLMMMISSLTVFDLVFIMTNGGPGFSSYVISLYMYFNGFIYNRVGYAASLSLTLTFFVFILSLLFMWLRERRRVV